jgi:hypothetical protein
MKPNQPNELRRALLLDAGASGTMGLILAIAATSLQPVLGLPVLLMRTVGLFLIPFAALLAWIATRRVVSAGLVRVVVIGNALWVVASLLLLVIGAVSPTLLGTLFVLAQALAVTVFVYLERRALGTLTTVTSS